MTILTKKQPNVAPPSEEPESYAIMGDCNSDAFTHNPDSTAYRPRLPHKSSSGATYVEPVHHATESTPFASYNSSAHHVNWSKEGHTPPEPTWLERTLGLPQPLIWLLFNSIVSILWGIALAVFMSGVVTVTFALSEIFKRANELHDFDYMNEIIGLVGSFATMHVTHVLQLAVAEYSHIVMAREFRLRDLRWMQGVKEMSLFTEFPARSEEGPASEQGGRFEKSWRAMVEWMTALRLSWYIIYFGVALHTMSIVAIMSPKLKIQHVPFDDPIPCGIDASSLTLGPGPLLSDAQQAVIDRLAFDVGVQLNSYIDQVNGNTTTTLAGRRYRKESYGYGVVGGLANGLQETPGVQYIAECVDGRNIARSTELWERALPGLVPPAVSPPYTSFSESTEARVPSTHGRIVSDPSLDFNLTLHGEGAMYAVVNPQGSGALMSLGRGGRDPSGPEPMQIVCAWQAIPKLILAQTVNFTSLAIKASDSPLYPVLAGRATFHTLRGMAAATRLGASIDPEASRMMRTELVRSDFGGATVTQILEYLLADGTKAATTAYNLHFRAGALDLERPPLPAMCNSKNKTVAEHWRFGNDKNLGWIAVVWTIGIGVVGVVLTFWMARKRSLRLEGASPLDAMGGFMLGRGGVIAEEQRLRIVDGKVVDVQGPMKL